MLYAHSFYLCICCRKVVWSMDSFMRCCIQNIDCKDSSVFLRLWSVHSYIFHFKVVLSNQENLRYLKRKFTGSVQSGPKVRVFTVRFRFAYFLIENGTWYICIHFSTFNSWMWSSLTSDLASKECMRGIEISCVPVHSSSFGQISRSRSSVFCVVTRLRVWRSRVQIPVWARDLLFLQNVQTGPGTHPAKYSLGTGVISQGYSSLSVKLTIHLHLVLMLRMSGSIPLLPPYASLVWLWKNFTSLVKFLL